MKYFKRKILFALSKLTLVGYFCQLSSITTKIPPEPMNALIFPRFSSEASPSTAAISSEVLELVRLWALTCQAPYFFPLNQILFSSLEKLIRLGEAACAA